MLATSVVHASASMRLWLGVSLLCALVAYVQCLESSNSCLSESDNLVANCGFQSLQSDAYGFKIAPPWQSAFINFVSGSSPNVWAQGQANSHFAMYQTLKVPATVSGASTLLATFSYEIQIHGNLQGSPLPEFSFEIVVGSNRNSINSVRQPPPYQDNVSTKETWTDPIGVQRTGTPPGQEPITSYGVKYSRSFQVQLPAGTDVQLSIGGDNRASRRCFIGVDNIVVQSTVPLVAPIVTSSSSTGGNVQVMSSSSSSTGVPVGGAAQSTAAAPVSGVTGDPQFVGFLGQQYQVHGSSGNVYNVISSRHLQYNALFTFLSHGDCRPGTECFSHPGNYFGQVGVLIKNDGSGHEDNKDAASMGYHSKKFVDAHAFGGSTKDGHDDDDTDSVDGGNVNVGQSSKAQAREHGDHVDLQLTVTAGSVSDGMRVQLGNATLSPSNRHIRLSAQSSAFFPSRFEFYIETVDFTIKLENSDMFLNQAVSINQQLIQQIQAYEAAASTTSNSKEQSPQINSRDLPHGVLGQTWQKKTYQNKWKYVQGSLNEYIVDDGILGTQFKYNRFE